MLKKNKEKDVMKFKSMKEEFFKRKKLSKESNKTLNIKNLL